MSLRSNDVSFGGSPRIHAGEDRFSAPGKSCTLIMRFGAGLERFQGYKAHSKMERFSAGLKSSSPLLKQGAPTRIGVDDIGGPSLLYNLKNDSKDTAELGHRLISVCSSIRRKRSLAFAHLCRPTYALANVGHPSIASDAAAARFSPALQRSLPLQ
jgi:hypothetical protein